ncbi:hypothetical protein, partial [Escherichia coli]|uniref:hypothetical protein n=1 Tax=Escherichia coli TaxID=562 RepID=UPI001BC865E7
CVDKCDEMPKHPVIIPLYKYLTVNIEMPQSVIMFVRAAVGFFHFNAAYITCVYYLVEDKFQPVWPPSVIEPAGTEVTAS